MANKRKVESASATELAGALFGAVLAVWLTWSLAVQPIVKMKNGKDFSVHLSDGMKFAAPDDVLQVVHPDGTTEDVKVLTSHDVTMPAVDVTCQPSKAWYPNKDIPEACKAPFRQSFGWPAWSPWLSIGIPLIAGWISLVLVLGALACVFTVVRRLFTATS